MSFPDHSFSQFNVLSRNSMPGLIIQYRESYEGLLNGANLDFRCRNQKEGSFIMLGGWDDELIDEKEIKMKVGEEATVGRNAQAIADTGTSWLVGPEEDIERIARALGAIKHRGLYLTDGSQLGDLPDITIKINGNDFTLEPSEYTIQAGEGLAVLAFLPQPDSDLWILGDIFLRKYYSIYNSKDLTVGFAPLKHNRYYY